MKKITNRNKFFIVVTLALIVVGMAMLGVFGLGGSVDYPNKNANGYELQVSVNMNAGDSVNILKSSTEEFFASKGLNPQTNSTQTLAEGKQIIYKFATDVSASATELKTFIEGKLSSAGVESVKVEANVYQVYAKGLDGIGLVCIATGIILVVVLAYALIMEKLAGALATAFATLLSAMLTVSLIAICRIPVQPFLAIGFAASIAIAGALAIATVNRLKEERKANETLTNAEVVEKVAKAEKSKYIAFVIAIALLAVALLVLGMSYVAFAGIQLLIATVCATFSAYLGAPFIWGLVKKENKK